MAAAKLTPYTRTPSPIRSQLIKVVPDSVPSTDELEALHEELKLLKARTLERAKKVTEDFKQIEETYKRMREKEKGKAKQIEKVKRERDFTPLPEADDIRVKSRIQSKPVPSLPPSSARSSLDPRGDDAKKHKKKRKRDDESDHEDGQKPRKGTPPAQHTHPPKAQKSTSSASQPSAKSSTNDWAIPPPVSLLPTRPVLPPPSKPGPSKPTDVMEDFSQLKQPTQTSVSIFYSFIEPYLRPIREEDIGFLEHTGDEVEPFIMPKLGRHYTENWAEMDAKGPDAGDARDAEADSYLPPAPKWDPSTLAEGDLLNESRGHGPLTERVLSALLPMPDATPWKGVKAAEDAMEGRPGGSAAAAARKEKMNVSDLEARIRDTMRYHGLLDSIPDYSDKVDDPIATALRHAQSELRQVVAVNKARKARLVKIARDRLGHQEYIESRDAIDKSISNSYTKLQKKNEPKVNKKKKKLDDASGSGTPAPGEGSSSHLPPCPAALGLGPDEDNNLVVPDSLNQLVQMRRQWVDTVGGIFDQRQQEEPGSMWGFPEKSIYQDMEDEVQEILRTLPEPRRKQTAASPSRDAMDLG
ncbi:unnamed protein product [Mycena citricolor]|uniref:Histone acetyltransferases subunit 3-domain-containing protein n=1 Tax=Mycena citricolor TaxID=2018698 RepID=A0AAD2GVQ8_9AGAR|nr:unnamed protein product [Mycena citricolor]CAK5279146.1 unnamed protein product [Mycena citricolor]CAK5281075.1 unnamed protein product [Mycena citricolor]